MQLSRRGFLATTAALSTRPMFSQKSSSIPIGLEMYSVRRALMQDLMGTVRAVGEMGYQDVEFYAPYYQWTEQQTKDVRKLMDDVGLKCLSTHNNLTNYQAANVQ